MTATIVNAAPMTIFLGTQDDSPVQVTPVPEVLPTHLPIVYLYTQKGDPTVPLMVVGDSRTQTFGDASFDLTQIWATHGTVLANTLDAQANSVFIQRLQPVDAPPPATIRCYMDVLATTIPNYVRNSDGSIELDNSGNPVTTGTPNAGYKVKFVVEQIGVGTGNTAAFGAATQGAGDQSDSVTNVQSTRYPMFDAEISSFGSWGSNTGLALWAPTVASPTPINPALLEQGIYPLRMACLSRASTTASPSVTQTLSGDQYVDVCFKPNTINAVTEAMAYIGDVFIQAYQSIGDPVLPDQVGPFGQIHLYDSEILTCLNLFYAAETPFINQFSDFTGAANEQYLFNILGGVSSQNVPYYSYQVVTGASNSTTFNQNTTVYALGGGDGTMNETLYAGLVSEAIAAFGDPNSLMQNDAEFPVSIFYDSGFPIATKKALSAFIAVRKDTFLVASTHDVLQPQNTAAEDSSIAVALQSYYQNYPDSDYYGTPTFRAMIMGRSGTLRGSLYGKPLPLTIELASKAAAYMGAGDGIWKSGLAPDQQPNNQVTLFTNINVTFTPASVRNSDWADGLNWVDSFARKSYYFPAYKTIYNNDTSVLNGWLTAMAICELQKVGSRAQRQVSGTEALTQSQTIERVNSYVTQNTTNRFDNRFIIQPNTYYTTADQQRGYSWSLAITIGAPNEQTVETLSIVAKRIADVTPPTT